MKRDNELFSTDNLLPIVTKQSDHPCFECAQCCTYVALEIDTPTTAKEYDYVVWYLVHRGVSLFVDWEDDWYLKFETRCNLGMVELEKVFEPQDLNTLKTMIELHMKYTGSRKAKKILDSWPGMVSKFVKVMPLDYKRVLAEREAAEKKANREKEGVAHG